MSTTEYRRLVDLGESVILLRRSHSDCSVTKLQRTYVVLCQFKFQSHDDWFFFHWCSQPERLWGIPHQAHPSMKYLVKNTWCVCTCVWKLAVVKNVLKKFKRCRPKCNCFKAETVSMFYGFMIITKVISTVLFWWLQWIIFIQSRAKKYCLHYFLFVFEWNLKKPLEPVKIASTIIHPIRNARDQRLDIH